MTVQLFFCSCVLFWKRVLVVDVKPCHYVYLSAGMLKMSWAGSGCVCCYLSHQLWSLCVFLRPLFKDASGAVDKSARFSALYRQDGNKLSNEDMFRLLADFRKSVLQSRAPIVALVFVWPAEWSCTHWCCFSQFCQRCWCFRNSIVSLRLRQALTLVILPSFVLSLLSGQKRWPSCLWFWVIWMSRLIASHQIWAVSLSYSHTSVSECSERHMLSVWSGSGLIQRFLSLCVCRLCHALLSSSASDWWCGAGQAGVWGGGVCAIYRQILPAFHNLQQPPVCVSTTSQIRQPEKLHEGTTTLKYSTHSSDLLFYGVPLGP